MQLAGEHQGEPPEYSEALELGAARWQIQDGVFEGANNRLAELPG